MTTSKDSTLEQRYKDLVRQIFEVAGFRVKELGPLSSLLLDMVLINPKGEEIIVDLKLYRTSFIDPSVVGRALEKLFELSSQYSGAKLILSSDIPHSWSRSTKVNGYKVEIIDYFDLLRMAGDNKDIASQLHSIFREIRINEPDDSSSIFSESTPYAPIDNKTDIDGLRKSIVSCGYGRKGAVEFEGICTEALKILFAKEFNKWTTQNRVEKGFHRFDLIAHLQPTHDFWKGLQRDFRTRFVIFEFKNYSDRIGQEQIYTTEKYLYTNALRSVAIVFSRKGEDRGASASRMGALRETGKLILSFSQDDLLRMLELFERGDDPHLVLFDELYGMLTSIAR